jgi:hypothetical protein
MMQLVPLTEMEFMIPSLKRESLIPSNCLDDLECMSEGSEKWYLRTFMYH